MATSQEYVIPLTKELDGKNAFSPEVEDRYPQVFGPLLSIRPVLAAEEVRLTYVFLLRLKIE